MKIRDIEIQPQDIVLFHVGGSLSSYGPIDSVLSCFPRQCVIFAFEAREDEEDEIIQTEYGAKGVRIVRINACIAETVGTFSFLINKHGESSSMLPPSPQALDEHILGYPPGVRTWRDNTELERVVPVNTITLQELMKQQDVIPDVMSLDAQGMELRIMEGSGSGMSLVNSIVSEVEFFEIYSGQGLFHEQMLFLDSYGFRLTDLLNSQYWYPGPACGKGLFTVAEALWLKKIDAFLELNVTDNHFIMRGVKLSAVAFAFERYSYSYTLLKELMNCDKVLLAELCHKHGFEILLKMVDEVDNNLSNYALDNTFFVRHPLSVQTGAKLTAPIRRSLRHFLARAARKVGRVVVRYLET